MAVTLWNSALVGARACHDHQPPLRGSASPVMMNRRTLSLGMGMGMGMGIGIGMERSASAAGKRGPPPPAKEKQDPSVSGVLAKVIASKRRKEAMKQEIAKLRLKGTITPPPPPPPPQ